MRSFPRQSLPMNTPRFGFPRPFLLAAGPAAYRRRPDIALRCFIPPLLLGGSPDFRLATVLTLKGPILIVAALDKIRDAVAVGSPQPDGRDGHGSQRTIYGPGVAGAGFLRIAA